MKMWTRWALLWLFMGVEEAYSAGLRASDQYSRRENMNQLVIEEEEALLVFLEANMSMSMDTKPPTLSPVANPPTVRPTTLSPTGAPITNAPTSSPVTQAPTPPPVTQAPTPPPVTMVPTPPPVTDSPTVTPMTTSPTVAPILPTLSPTVGETSPPTVSPIDTPAPVATATPTVPPVATSSPTFAPVETTMPSSATRLPTISPTSLPTIKPTVPPTDVPTSFPSSTPTSTCNLSEEERAMLIRSFLETISNDGSLDEPGSPQNLAATWLIEEDMAYLCPQDPTLVQRYALAVFYYSTEGDDWFECTAPTNFSSAEAIQEANDACDLNVTENPLPVDAWLTPSSECDWGALACNAAGFIERIDFEKNGVGGELPSEISRLMSLKYLIAEEGLISGVIPMEIGFLNDLVTIDLNFNAFTGSLPESLYRLSNLQELDLNDNKFSGSLSTQISRLQQLVLLQIQNNDMTGTIPNQLGNLFLLEYATMEGNNFMGTMPPLVCQNRTGLLKVLTADCLGGPDRPSPPYVDCPCCTTCY